MTSPGTPDTYQGDELWNYTLVDPDNRRPVDYDARTAAFRGLDVLPRDPWENRFKLFVVRRLLALRREIPALFAHGTYVPLAVRGPRASNVLAFMRSHDEHHIITIAQRLIGDWVARGAGAEWWEGTEVELPHHVAGTILRSKLIEQDTLRSSDKLELASLLHTIPVAVLGS
jgi:(1->4)-alpha-D-glucan 1-alpha-D-glucosylmutase